MYLLFAFPILFCIRSDYLSTHDQGEAVVQGFQSYLIALSYLLLSPSIIYHLPVSLLKLIHRLSSCYPLFLPSTLQYTQVLTNSFHTPFHFKAETQNIRRHYPVPMRIQSIHSLMSSNPIQFNPHFARLLAIDPSYPT